MTHFYAHKGSVPLCFVGAEAGVPTAEAGAVISKAGTISGIAIDMFNEDFGSGLKSALFYKVGRKLEKLIDKIPECEDIANAILKHGTNIKLKLMETTVDAVTNKHQEEQKRKEEDDNK